MRQLLGETENTSASLGAECRSLLLASAFIFVGGLGMKTQLFVPIRLEGIGDEAVVGIDFHITPTRQLGFVSHPLDMLTACRVGLRGARLELALNLQSDRQCHRCHQFDHQGCHRFIDELAGNRLAGPSGAAYRVCLAEIGRDNAAVLLAVAHAHAFAT